MADSVGKDEGPATCLVPPPPASLPLSPPTVWCRLILPCHEVCVQNAVLLPPEEGKVYGRHNCGGIVGYRLCVS